MKDEGGQVGIIGALLLIGVALIVVSWFLTYQLPEMTRNEEISHLTEVFKAFADMQQGLASYIESGRTGVIYPVSFPIGRPSAFFGIGGITGSLAMSDENFYVNSTSSLSMNSSLLYEPSITQTVPQTYSYEMGAVVLRQGDRALMKIDPPITIDRDLSTITLNMTMISLTTMDITSRVGTGYVTINFFVDYTMPVSFYGPGNRVGDLVFDFHTPNAGAWRKYFEELMEPVGAEFYNFDRELNSPDRFYMTLKNVDLVNSNIRYAIVRVSIGG